MIGVIIDLVSYPKLNIAKCTDQNNLLFLILTDDQFRLLESKNQGEERTAFFNSEEFRKKIIYWLCTEFDHEHKIIYMGDCSSKYAKKFLDTIHSTFEESVTIKAGLHLKNNLPKDLISMGFANPSICSKDKKICLDRKNTFIPKNEKEPKSKLVELDLEFLLKQKDKPHCNIKLEIDKDSREFLKHLTTSGVTQEEDGRSQKEIFGLFKISKGQKGDKGIILYTLKVNRDSLVTGDKEEIEAVQSLYNFHTHPKEAYLRHGVKFGIPSIADYCAVFELSKKGTIIHFVATLEGIYAISLNPSHHILRKKTHQVLEFIEDKMPTDRSNIKKYLEKANSIGLFKVELIAYDKATQIEAVFNKQGAYSNCVIHE